MEIDVTSDGVGDVKATLSELREWGTTSGTVVVMSDVHYAIFVEMGTWKMPANRGLRNAIDATMGNAHVYAAAADGVDDLIETLAQEIARRWRDWVWVDTGKLQSSITVSRY